MHGFSSEEKKGLRRSNASGGEAMTKTSEVSVRHEKERNAPMMLLVWISAERDEWMLSNAVCLEEQDACTRMQPNDS